MYVYECVCVNNNKKISPEDRTINMKKKKILFFNSISNIGISSSPFLFFLGGGYGLFDPQDTPLIVHSNVDCS